MGRFVALGDSLTEGAGDPHGWYPNGLRGWADLFALELSRSDPDLEYANLALRAKRATDVLEEQVDTAVALTPSLVTLWAGGNDILRPDGRMRVVVDTIEQCVERLTATGATVLMFTGFDLAPSPLLGPARRRIARLNDQLVGMSRDHDIALVDVRTLTTWSSAPLLGPDRVHPTPLGHRHLARRVGDVLGLPTGVVDDEWWREPASRSLREAAQEEWGWWRSSVLPQVRRWASNASAKEGHRPKWATPVRPAQWALASRA